MGRTTADAAKALSKPRWKLVLIGACVVLGLAQVIGGIVVYFAYR